MEQKVGEFMLYLPELHEVKQLSVTESTESAGSKILLKR